MEGVHRTGASDCRDSLLLSPQTSKLHFSFPPWCWKCLVCCMGCSVNFHCCWRWEVDVSVSVNSLTPSAPFVLDIFAKTVFAVRWDAISSTLLLLFIRQATFSFKNSEIPYPNLSIAGCMLYVSELWVAQEILLRVIFPKIISLIPGE